MRSDILALNEARQAKIAAQLGAMPAAFRLFNQSDTYTVPFRCMMDMLLVGGGASGGMTYSSGVVAGAGAGEVAMLYGKVFEAGTVLSVAVGTGGAPVTRSTAGQTKGNPGGTTAVYNASLGFNLAAFGGQPGDVGAVNTLQGGGPGGTGGGASYPVAGALHFPGGSGGSATSTTFGVAGGGAVNIMGWSSPTTKLDGGSLTSGSGAAGGAGVGGKGGDKTTATANSFSPGGGSGGPGDNALSSAAAAGPNAVGMRTQASMSSLATLATWGLDYFGGGGYTTVAPGPGGGSSGDTVANIKASGIFGGMGGAFNGSTTVTAIPQAGIGGGGAGLHVVSTAGWMSGRGGDGLVVLVLRRLP